MIAFLDKEKKQLETTIKSENVLLEDMKKTLKKSEIQIKEDERSALTLQDAQRTKKSQAQEKLYHEQEVSVDTMEHHLDTEQEHLEIISEKISDYTKDTKKLLKVVEKEKKTLSKLKKDLKKNALAKKLMS